MNPTTISNMRNAPFAALFFGLALAVSAHAAELPSEKYDLSMARGASALDEGHYKTARSAFKAALSARPRDAKASYFLGVSLRFLKQYKEADRTLKAVLEKNPDFGEVHFDLGIVAFHLGHAEEAVAELVKSDAVRGLTDSQRAMSHYYRGLAYEKLDRFDEAGPEFLRAASLAPGLAADAQYHAGLSFFRRGAPAEARDSFEEVVEASPESPIGKSARKLLARIEEMNPRPKRWSLSAGLSVQYDSNVILLPGDSPVPEGISDESDIRWVGTFNSGFDVFRSVRSTATASYGLYQSLHQDLDMFDVQNHDLGISFKHRPIRKPLQFDFGYHFSIARIDNKTYLRSQTVDGRMSLSRREGHLTRFEYRYQMKDFQEVGSLPGNEDRTGYNNALGLTHYWFFSGRKGNLHGGYTFDRDRTVEDDWDYHGHAFRVGVKIPPRLVGGWVDPSLDAEVGFRQYDNPNSLSSDSPAKERKDAIQTYTLTLSRSFNRWLSGNLQYLINVNSSNIDAYDYRRQVGTVNFVVSL